MQWNVISEMVNVTQGPVSKVWPLFNGTRMRRNKSRTSQGRDAFRDRKSREGRHMACQGPGACPSTLGSRSVLAVQQCCDIRCYDSGITAKNSGQPD